MPDFSGQQLEEMGKRAAVAWSRGEHASLNQAAAQVIKTAGSLSREQMTRVVEFTNRNAYLEFHNNKLAGAHRYVEFPGGPARVDEVIKQATGVPESVQYRSLADYQSAPEPRTKQASWEELFGVERFMFSKEATGDPAADAFKQLVGYRQKLANEIRNMRSDLDLGEVEVDYARSALVEQMKVAHQEGATLRDLVRGLSSVSTDPGAMKIAFQLAHPSLMRAGHHTPHSYAESMKVASPGVLDESHPLLAAYSHLIDVSGKLATKHVELMQLRSKLAEVDRGIALVKRANPEAPAESWGTTLANYGRKAWEHMDSAAKTLNQGGADLGKSLMGDKSLAHRVGGHLGTAVVKGVPAAVGLGLAYRGLQHARALGDSRVGRAVKAYIPGTDENLMDEMRIRQMYGADQYGYPGMGY